MSRVYVMNSDSTTTQMTRLRCRDEDKELQSLLAQNLELLPGDQIDPELPRKWLLIKREMPVIDPGSGAPRWSIDFFLVDQVGVPTLVECKRCDDSRSRREVVGQMLEYSANGHHYWTASEMRSYAEAANSGADELELKLKAICGEAAPTAEEFFKIVETNLRESKLRLIFLLEESPLELRSVVDFLNKQMKDTEVLLVEARQYQQEEFKVVVPWLFGFTEEARVAKRASREEIVRSSQARGPDAYWAAAKTAHEPERLAQMEEFIQNLANTENCTVSWANSCLISFPNAFPKRALFGIWRKGNLEIEFGYWNEKKRTDVTPEQVALRNQVAVRLQGILGPFTTAQLENYPNFAPEKWLPKATELQELIHWIAMQVTDAPITPS